MRILFLVALCSLAAAFSLQAATTEKNTTDSLKLLLSSSVSDSVKVKVLGDLSWAYIVSDQFDSAEYYANQILRLAEETNHQNRLALGEFYLGCVARHRGWFQKSLEHLGKYIAWQVQSGDSLRLAYGLFQVGAVHSSLGNYEESLFALYRILRIYQAQNSYFDIGYTLNGIGIIYKNSQKYEAAVSTYQKALAIYDSLNSLEDKGNVLLNLANVYAITEKYDSAKHHYRQALKVMESLGREKGVAFVLENLGEAYKSTEKYDSALLYQSSALAIRERSLNKNELASTLQQIGHTNYLLQNYSVAKGQLLRALKLATEVDAKPVLKKTYATLVTVHEREHNYQLALKYQKLWSAVKDSLFNTEVSQQINELQTKYETEEKEQKITLLAQEKEIQAQEANQQVLVNKALFGGLLLICIIAGLTLYLFHQRLKNQNMLSAKSEELKSAQFKQQLSELEMKALRAQMNPHFIFNCLNSINRMVMSGESRNAARYLTKFAKLIRLMLENSEHSTVSLADELTMLKAYLDLERLRFKEKINYQFTIDDEIDCETTNLPPMVLQPFIENAILHGLMHKDTPGLVNISISEDTVGLKCTIQDNGVGREKSMILQRTLLGKRKSMGLQITEQRLEIFSNHQVQDLVNITDLKDSMNQALGTRVDILIPTS